MNYSQIRTMDISNGEGIRTSIFVSGCNRHCKGCFNKEAWDFNRGKNFNSEKYFKIYDLLKKPYYAGLSILGGEPFDQKDNYLLIELCKAAHTMGKDVWIWSGYTFEELKIDDKKLELLQECDVLVDGPFIDEQKDLSLKWRGSTNQRIINIKESLASGKVVEYR